MCPNCVLNQAGMNVGVFIAFGVCAVFFVVGIAAILWAFRNGDFEDVEGSKFEMMDDDLDGGEVARRARAARDASKAQQVQG